MDCGLRLLNAGPTHLLFVSTSKTHHVNQRSTPRRLVSEVTNRDVAGKVCPPSISVMLSRTSNLGARDVPTLRSGDDAVARGSVADLEEFPTREVHRCEVGDVGGWRVEADTSKV